MRKRIGRPPADSKRKFVDQETSTAQCCDSLRSDALQVDERLACPSRLSRSNEPGLRTGQLRVRAIDLKDCRVGFTQTLKQGSKKAECQFRMRLQRLDEVVAMQFTHCCSFDGNDSSSARLFLDHSHLAERLSRSDIGQMYIFPAQAPKHFHPTLFDDVRGFTGFVFPEDDLTRCQFTNSHTATPCDLERWHFSL